MVTIKCGDRIFPEIEAILFDKDGTLANSEACLITLGYKRVHLLEGEVAGVQDPLLQAFGLQGERLNPAGLLAVGSRQENEIAAATYLAERGWNWLDAIELTKKVFCTADRSLQRKADHTPFFTEAMGLLKTLFQSGVKLGILSADSDENVQDFVLKYQLQNYFSLQWGVKGTLSKPDPAFFLSACDSLQVLPEQVLMVGDAATDMAMARAAGAAGAIGVIWGWSIPDPPLQADVLLMDWQQIQVL